MRTILALCLAGVLLLPAAAPAAQERQLVATIDFAVGSATLSDAQRAQLDEIARRYPAQDWNYTFEGDHDPKPFRRLSHNASLRLNERLAETRWQNVAEQLGVPPLGLVNVTSKNEARVYVERRTAPPQQAVPATPPGWQDSLAALRRDQAARARQLEALQRQCTPAPAETVLAVARLEELDVRLDKWAEKRWWEAQGGLELGLLRVQPERGGHRPSGAALVLGDGTPAYRAFEISLRLDLFRIGPGRFGITPALRWYDWDMEVHYGDDPEAATSFLNNANPVYLLGLDLDAAPWHGGRVQVKYAGVGARVHAVDRELISYDQYDLRFDQRFTRNWWLQIQGVYDERFHKSLCYAGGWIARGWPLRIGVFSLSLGFVEQLDAFAATREGREDPVSTISLGFEWRRANRFRY